METVWQPATCTVPCSADNLCHCSNPIQRDDPSWENFFFFSSGSKRNWSGGGAGTNSKLNLYPLTFLQTPSYTTGEPGNEAAPVQQGSPGTRLLLYNRARERYGGPGVHSDVASAAGPPMFRIVSALCPHYSRSHSAPFPQHLRNLSALFPRYFRIATTP